MNFEQWWNVYWKNHFSVPIMNEAMKEIAKSAWEASALEMKDQFDDELEHERNNVASLRQQVEDLKEETLELLTL